MTSRINNFRELHFLTQHAIYIYLLCERSLSKCGALRMESQFHFWTTNVSLHAYLAPRAPEDIYFINFKFFLQTRLCFNVKGKLSSKHFFSVHSLTFSTRLELNCEIKKEEYRFYRVSDLRSFWKQRYSERAAKFNPQLLKPLLSRNHKRYIQIKIFKI